MYDISLSDIYIKNITSVAHDIRLHSWKHNHPKVDSTEMYFVLKGEFSLKYNNKTTIYREGDFMFMPSNTEYCSQSITLPTEIIEVFFQSELPENTELNIFYDMFHLHKCSDTVRNAFKNMNHLFLLKQPGFQLDIKKEMYKISSIVLNKIRIKDLDNYNYYIIKNADKYIKENYLKEVISIEHLASLCQITPSYFTRIFKSVFGMSPKKYIIDLKMQAACEYLTYTSTSVIDISKTLGYDDITYFTASFKKHFGISPMEYRRKHNMMIN